ncbi:MAG: DUF2177 family protein [Erysipelotrichaceae bacterium]
MFQQLKLFMITLLIFLVVDFVWLAFISRSFYQQQLGHLMSEKINWVAACIFYVLFVCALIYFVIQPSLQTQNIQQLIISSLFFGLITYATYDLTNLATLASWPLVVSLVDIVWGSGLSLVTSLLTFWIMR